MLPQNNFGPGTNQRKYKNLEWFSENELPLIPKMYTKFIKKKRLNDSSKCMTV